MGKESRRIAGASKKLLRVAGLPAATLKACEELLTIPGSGRGAVAQCGGERRDPAACFVGSSEPIVRFAPTQFVGRQRRAAACNVAVTIPAGYGREAAACSFVGRHLTPLLTNGLA